jgi:predicted ATPase
MNNIGFKNIKVFKDWQNFDFKNITLLTGTNNSGKSSVINTMQMLQENLTAKNLDELLATEFVLKANQNKYGTIRSFINNKSEDDTIAFSIIINNLTYKVKLKINEGLQTKGTVSSIEIFSSKNEQIFNLNLVEINSKPKIEFCINFEYFINQFYKKCENTVTLHKRFEVLDKLDLTNPDIFNNFKKLCKDIENDFDIDIRIDKCDSVETGFTCVFFVPRSLKYTDKALIAEDVEPGIPNVPEVLITAEEFLEKFETAFENGIYNFSLLSKYESFEEFKELICKYYSSGFEESAKMLSKDLIKLSSKCKWTIVSAPEYIDKPLKDAISNITDFGLVTQRFSTNNKFFPNFALTGFASSIELKLASKIIDDKANNDNLWYEIEDSLKKLLNENINDDASIKRGSKGYWGGEGHLYYRLVSKHIYDSIFSEIKNSILDFNLAFNNQIYVSSNRFNTKRTYSFNDNTDFTNLLKQIENLNPDTKKIAKDFINKWLKEFEIADELILKSDLDTGNFKAILRQNEIETLLSDYGLGTNQLLPIIFSLAIHEYYDSYYDGEKLRLRTVVIEEPEANLHPAMQSKLADMFADAIKTFNVKIIAETHSEYLIRKLQYLVASNKSEVKPDDVVIYYINKPNNPDVLSGETEQVNKIEIDEFGRLNKEFGKGFFDEADNIAMDLFLLQQSQSN